MKKQILFLSVLALISCSEDDNSAQANVAPSASDIAITMNENPNSDLLAQVNATDANGDVLTYSILSQTPANAMIIDANDGRLLVNNPQSFDFERYNKVEAVVAVTDGEFTINVNVELNLTDIAGPDGGLIAYFPFNGNSNDGSGNGNNGTASTTGLNVVANRFGKTNSAYEFDGGYITIPSFGTSNTNFTISAWVYQDSNLGTVLGDRTILAKAGSGREYVMKLQNQYANAHFYTNTYFHTTSDITMPTDAWFNYILKVEGTTWKLYKDGVLIKTVSHASSNPWGTNNVVIGALTGTGTESFNGKIDDILFYNRALTDIEIQGIANNSY